LLGLILDLAKELEHSLNKRLGMSEPQTRQGKYLRTKRLILLDEMDGR
jgi:hypothetical protein